MPEASDTARRDSIGHTLRVATAVSLVCSIMVASAAVLLESRQAANVELDRQRNILEVAGLLSEDADVAALFGQVQARVVDLATGEYTDAIEPDFDAIDAARSAELGVKVPPSLDVANVSRRARYATVYVVGDGADAQIILPFHGAGLWATIRGFISLRADGDTIAGITFYEHAETPGLGAEIDTPAWRALWEGRRVFDTDGNPRIEVVKGRVVPGTDLAVHQVDGLAGATLTGRGVTRMLHYWLGEHGFGPYLARLAEQGD